MWLTFLRAIDQKEALVKVFDFPQIDGSPPAGEGDFWNAIKVRCSVQIVT